MIFEYILNGISHEQEVVSAKINEITILKCIVLGFVPNDPDNK
jgi:hypothetical protein